ncbi:adenosylcobinamide-phosphate synthase CbiB [Paratractidigestivibacter sp.]|uniref:adenosylcobinamide-phosphate synthase CbiB n=1 Tax=Paratractidigestivibacter sp. TaxID=2847316 RepID=UPI002AC8F8CE|nr:adenosylcobinamide-phosphate synthase CbiB [Paratractidigestivibacter sp.]
MLAMLLGFLLDLLLGDPRWLPHPVVGMGRTISAAEKRLRASFPDTAEGRRRAGAVLAFALPVSTLVLADVVLWLAGLAWLPLQTALETIMCYQALATRELWRQTVVVGRRLDEGDLSDARKAVSMVVGRDTASLDAAGVTRAAVETVAENASDGVIAPLFFMALGGGPLALAYKAVNTMDSMIGYKNERYLDFGRVAARLDDVCNWVPSRLAALLMVAVCPALGFDAAGAWRIWRRDRSLSTSPNSGQTEAACAGALGLRLLGDAYYFGKLVHKPAMGDDTRQIETEDIRRANRLMVAASVAMLVLGCALRAVICAGSGVI